MNEKQYVVKFKAFIPAEITAVINADNMNEAITRTMDNDFYQFWFEQTSNFKEIRDISLLEVKDRTEEDI